MRGVGFGDFGWDSRGADSETRSPVGIPVGAEDPETNTLGGTGERVDWVKSILESPVVADVGGPGLRRLSIRVS